MPVEKKMARGVAEEESNGYGVVVLVACDPTHRKGAMDGAPGRL